MVGIPGGSFMMGSDRDYPKKSESLKVTGFYQRVEFGWKPRHRVELSAYCVDKFEVTVAKYRECVNASVCKKPGVVEKDHPEENSTWDIKGKEQHPINLVSYMDANDYCKWKGGHLPTEAQWEYAARGSDGREYPWGAAPNGEILTCQDTLANKDQKTPLAASFGEASTCFPGVHGTWEVGSAPKGASPFGVLDMAGNVMEWVEDRGDFAFYKPSPVKDPRNPPKDPKSDNYGILRGGGWSHGGGDNKSLAPGWNSKTYWREPEPYWDKEKNIPIRDAEVGFRCAASPLQ